MRKLFFFIIVLFLFNTTKNYGQSLYVREWGTLLPIFSRTIKPFSPHKTTVRTRLFVTEVNFKTGHLYLVNADGNAIYEYRPEQPIPKLIYTIPKSDEGYVIIENLKFDFENNLILSGRTINENLATKGTYSEKMIFGWASRPTFISKINLEGNVIWSTYFHDLVPNASHLTIDSNNDIYILNKRNKNTVATNSSFQETGDLNSSTDYQDVISKLDKNGKHIWSTFYTKDHSSIKSIAAGTNGLYVYGDHLGAKAQSKYFGTPNSHQEAVSANNETPENISRVFLSKFSFEGKRLWSTYFGDQRNQISFGSTVKNNNSLVVVGDEAYILTSHSVSSGKSKNISTENTYLTEPMAGNNTTVSKFSSDGKRVWSSYLHAGEHIFSNGKELIISSSFLNGDNQNNIPTTLNAYQQKRGGDKLDAYTFILSLDGRTLKYASFYGYDGRDTGVTLPTKNGFYIIGTTDNNQNPKSPFVTSNAPKKEYFNNSENYIGDFLSYFKQNPKVSKRRKKKNDQ